MPSAFDVLARDHEEVKQMLTELERGPVAATGADPGQLALRKKMVQQLVIEESRHEAVEEMYFWPAVREHVTDGTDLANQAQGQKQDGKALLDRLDKLAPQDEEFEAQLTRFTRAAREHIAFEETVVWPSLRSAVTAGESRRPRASARCGQEERADPAAPEGTVRTRAAEGRGPRGRRCGPAPRRGYRPRRLAGRRGREH
jgi:hemerythrin-like domain-containing protein